MGLRLDSVVPWGRSLQEYIQMFDLTTNDLSGKILDCAGGPASFNAEVTALGHSVISCDPIYQFSASEISQRIEETFPVILKGVQTNQQNFVWTTIESPENLCQVRKQAMDKFLVDFPPGLQQGRYVIEELPSLSFNPEQFDLALCSHLLFTYSDQLSMEFHLTAIIEMCRVACEVRIFPLLVNMTGEVSPWLQPVLQELESQGYLVEIRQVPYEFQKGGNQLLRVLR
ncbi:SAM-dependent methyltransferase [Iningainema tapete]|uniref:SAM-dependent methyltransferase n=1 Tax=Iningainema tapete BLCC-T55 TaxID=2748662 RepID=A0A8J6XDS3_9CYAN|nr:SAM-dependent methyltransferase [Iningainema tapete]MBD2773544.1 SAM-dependent methyltransferase [Iningainema tapete BLCC-T55]